MNVRGVLKAAIHCALAWNRSGGAKVAQLPLPCGSGTLDLHRAWGEAADACLSLWARRLLVGGGALTVIAVINHKGGVGKTTTTVNLGAALQELGKRVLLIDLDPQSSLTIHLGLRHPDSLSATVADALEAKIASRGAPTLLDVLNKAPRRDRPHPVNRQLALTETLIGSRQGWAYILRECIQPGSRISTTTS